MATAKVADGENTSFSIYWRRQLTLYSCDSRQSSLIRCFTLNELTGTYEIIKTKNNTDHYYNSITDDTECYITGQECPCNEGMYCPMEAPLCFIDTAKKENGYICKSEEISSYLRLLFPLTIFLIIIITFLLFFSRNGRFARGYFHKVVCRYNDEQYDQLLNNTIDRLYQQANERRDRIERMRRLVVGDAFDTLPPVSEQQQQQQHVSETTNAEENHQQHSMVYLKTRLYEKNGVNNVIVNVC